VGKQKKRKGGENLFLKEETMEEGAVTPEERGGKVREIGSGRQGEGKNGVTALEDGSKRAYRSESRRNRPGRGILTRDVRVFSYDNKIENLATTKRSRKLDYLERDEARSSESSDSVLKKTKI